MPNKNLAVFTLLSFAVFSTACATWPTRAIQHEGDYPSPGRKVARVVKANGEVVDFLGPGLGRIMAGRVQGKALVSIEDTTELKGPFPLIKKRNDSSISEITDSTGRVHYVLSVVTEGPDSLVIEERRSETKVVSIPLAEVRLIKFRKSNTILTAAAVLGTVTVVLAVWATILISRD